MIQRTGHTRCLGERISRLADGTLADDVRDRALVHVAGCASCRARLDVERLLIERLRALPDPPPSSALLSSLLALGEPGGPLPPRSGRVPGTARPPNVAVAAPGRPPVPVRRGGSTRPTSRRGLGRSRRALVVAASALGVGVIAVAALGSALPPTGPGVVPPVDQLSVEHGVTGHEIPFSDAGLVRGGGPGPTAVPALVPAGSGR